MKRKDPTVDIATGTKAGHGNTAYKRSITDRSPKHDFSSDSPIELSFMRGRYEKDDQQNAADDFLDGLEDDALFDFDAVLPAKNPVPSDLPQAEEEHAVEDEYGCFDDGLIILDDDETIAKENGSVIQAIPSTHCYVRDSINSESIDLNASAKAAATILPLTPSSPTHLSTDQHLSTPLRPPNWLKELSIKRMREDEAEKQAENVYEDLHPPKRVRKNALPPFRGSAIRLTDSIPDLRPPPGPGSKVEDGQMNKETAPSEGLGDHAGDSAHGTGEEEFVTRKAYRNEILQLMCEYAPYIDFY